MMPGQYFHLSKLILTLYLFYRTEKEYKSVKKQLTNEVDNKKNVIGSLSKELEVHQKNFNELKDELNKVKL